MKIQITFSLLFVVFAVISAPLQAELTQLKDPSGKVIEAEILGVGAGTVDIKLKNGRNIPGVPLTKFSTESQAVIKKWAENNKGKMDRNSVFVTISEESKTGKREKLAATGNGWAKGKDGYTKDSTTKFKIRVQNRNSKSYENIQLSYTIYKEIRKRGFGGKGTDTEEDTIDGTLDIAALNGKAEEILETEEVSTKDTVQPVRAQKGKKAESQETKEKVDGIIVKVLHDGKEVMALSRPPGLLSQIQRREAQDN